MKLNLKTLQTLAKVAPRDDARTYLQSVHVIATSTDIRYEVTNGHYLIVAHEEREKDETETCDVIVPREFILSVKTAKSKSGAFDLCDFAVDGTDVAIAYYGAQFRTAAIDGKFPDIKRIIPTTVNGETAQFNPEYVATCSRVLQELNYSKYPPTLEHNGDGPSRMITNSTIAVIMPIRALEVIPMPDWVFGYPVVTQKQPEHEAIAA